MEKSGKDPTDERDGGMDGKISETDCTDGCCSWHENTPAQSGREKGGPINGSDDKDKGGV